MSNRYSSDNGMKKLFEGFREALNPEQLKGADDAVSRFKDSDVSNNPKALRGMLMDLVPNYDSKLIDAYVSVLYDFKLANSIQSGDEMATKQQMEQARKIYQDEVVSAAVSIFSQDGGVSIEKPYEPTDFDEEPPMQKAKMYKV